MAIVEVLIPGLPGPTGPAMTIAGPALAGRISGTGELQRIPLGTGLEIVNGALTVTGGTGGYPSLSMPTGFSVGGSGTATIAVTFATGYRLLTTAEATAWNQAATDSREWSAATATQAEAEAGSSTARLAFTPQRVFQAIAAWWSASAAATKLAGIASGATANATDAQLRDRANHTGTQAVATITGLAGVATSGAYGDLSGRPTLGTAAPLDVAAAGDASASQVVKGNDSRLSDARTPTAHSQAASTISDSTAAGRALLTAADAAAQRAAMAAVSSGAIGSSGLTMTAGILGRESGTGAPQIYSIGSGLSIVGGALVVTAGSSGTVTSVGLSVPTGFSVSGSPVTTSGTLALSFAAGYSLPSTSSQANWDTAYTERARWDGGATGLNATTGRASLGLGTAALSATGDFAAASHTQAASTISDSTAAGRALLTAADAAAQRTSLGLGTAATGAVSSAAPQALGATASAGTSGDVSRSDHVHPRSTYADLGAIGDGLVLVISNKGEAATAATNYAEVPVPVPSGNFILTAVRFGCHIDTTGSSSTTFNAYKRTAGGTKTSVLTANATLASSASLVDVSGTITGGTFAAGDRIGVDLVGVGTGVQGLFAQFIFTRSAT
jgi:hypothetical protein